MSKKTGLYALAELQHSVIDHYYLNNGNNPTYREDVEIIAKELQRLEAIENANPSEALKYVNGKIADLEDDLQHYTMVEKDKCREFYIREDLKQFTNIKQALLKGQEQEKVLEIIKEKKVSIFQLSCCKNVNEYNDLKFKDNEKITQEEFDLLKRYFK